MVLKLLLKKEEPEFPLASDRKLAAPGANLSSQTEESIFPSSRNFQKDEKMPRPRRIAKSKLEKLRAALQGLVSINQPKEQILALNDDEWKTLWQYHNPTTHTAEEFIQQVNSNYINGTTDGQN